MSAYANVGTLQPTVASVRTHEVTLGLSAPVRNGTTLISNRDYTFLEVKTTDGLSGTACGYTRDAPLGQMVERNLSGLVIGRSPFDSELIWHAARESGRRFLGTNGAFMRALSLLDIALWDLRGKLLGKSVASLLGASGARLPVLLAAGYYRSDESADDLEREYRVLAESGFRQFKIMAGGLPPEADAIRVNTVRAALPSEATLAVDVNGSWSTAEEAVSFLRALEEVPHFIEDPFPPGHMAALRGLRRYTSAPIAIGEWESGLPTFLELLTADVVDVLRLDVTAVGGVTEWMRVAALAAAFDKPIMPHFFPGMHAHLAAGLPTVIGLEVIPACAGADNFDALVADAWWSTGPVVEVSDRPGFGLEWVAL